MRSHYREPVFLAVLVVALLTSPALAQCGAPGSITCGENTIVKTRAVDVTNAPGSDELLAEFATILGEDGGSTGGLGKVLKVCKTADGACVIVVVSRAADAPAALAACGSACGTAGATSACVQPALACGGDQPGACAPSSVPDDLVGLIRTALTGGGASACREGGRTTCGPPGRSACGSVCDASPSSACCPDRSADCCPPATPAARRMMICDTGSDGCDIIARRSRLQNTGCADFAGTCRARCCPGPSSACCPPRPQTACVIGAGANTCCSDAAVRRTVSCSPCVSECGSRCGSGRAPTCMVVCCHPCTGGCCGHGHACGRTASAKTCPNPCCASPAATGVDPCGSTCGTNTPACGADAPAPARKVIIRKSEASAGSL